MAIVWTSLAYGLMALAFYQIIRRIYRFFKYPSAGCESCGQSSHCYIKSNKGEHHS